MDKNIGFRRNIYLSWLDAAAAFCSETHDPARIRELLDPIVQEQIHSAENRRMALDIVINIWVKTRDNHPQLWTQAVDLYARSVNQDDRLWLHYGMTLLAYDFFRLVASIIGQVSRYEETVIPKVIKQRVVGKMGQLGALEKATERVIFSLRNWGILVEGDARYAYRPLCQQVSAANPDVELWLLTAVLTVHPAAELPFADLLRQPELFPFRFSVSVDDLRSSSLLIVRRQGLGWDMVGLKSQTFE